MKSYINSFARIAVLLCVVLMIIFSAACQPTPETPAVVGKNAEVPENAKPYNRPDFPDAYNDTCSDNGATIIFDAAVELPESESLPTYEVHQTTFPQEHVDLIVKGLFGDAQLYAIAEPTKSDYEPEYVQALSDLKNKQEHPDQYENTEEYYQGRVDELKQLIENAPDTDNPEPIDTKLKKSPQRGTEALNARGDLGKDKMAELVILDNTDSEYMADNSLMWFKNGSAYSDLSTFYPYIKDAGPLGLNITKEQAIAAAEDIVSRLGANDMEYAACTTGISDSADATFGEEFDPAVPQSYLVYFTRNADGVPVTFDVRNTTSTSPDDYSVPVMRERLVVAVDDSGVTYIRWTAPVAIDKASVQNNSIIPFEDMMVLAKRQFCYLYAVQDGEPPIAVQAQVQSMSEVENGGAVSIEVHIEHIKLGLMQRIVKDEDRIELVPVWDFFGFLEVTYENGEKVMHYTDNISLLTIDAVNGSAIDREKGY